MPIQVEIPSLKCEICGHVFNAYDGETPEGLWKRVVACENLGKPEFDWEVGQKMQIHVGGGKLVEMQITARTVRGLVYSFREAPSVHVASYQFIHCDSGNIVDRGKWINQGEVSGMVRKLIE